MTDAYYVYAVVPAHARTPAGAAILPGAAVDILRTARVAALVSPVRAAAFDHAADADWTAERAVAHHGVVVAACAAGPCLPLAFGTLFSTPGPVVAWLEAREATLHAALATVAGAAEWSIDLAEDRPVHAAWLTAQLDELRDVAAAAALVGEGTAFLMRRRLERMCDAACLARRERTGGQIAELLHRHAAMATSRPPRWTALVPDHAMPALRQELAALAADMSGSGLELALSGPWPPYGFAREALADAA